MSGRPLSTALRLKWLLVVSFRLALKLNDSNYEDILKIEVRRLKF